MPNQPVIFDISYDSEAGNFILNLTVLETGEIIQKVKSKQWVMTQLFRSEILTREKNDSIGLVCEDVIIF